jgi:ABC-type transport system involved in cytochrome c biogenesis permease subunit
VPGRDSSLARALGFFVGFLLGWGGYALRAGVLPDTGAGRAVAAFLVIAVLTGVCAATTGWVPLWCGLLGVAAIAGAYEYAFTIDPTAFTSQSLTAATTVLLAAAVGFLVGGVGAAFFADDEQTHPAREPRNPLPQARTGDDAGVQILDKPAEA